MMEAGLRAGVRDGFKNMSGPKFPELGWRGLLGFSSPLLLRELAP
jgi:hypothetical protein